MKNAETEAERRARLREQDGWIAVDLDGTLAEWHGWKVSGGKIGKPIPLMVERVKGWLREGQDVRIFTARAAAFGNHTSNVALLEQRNQIEAWCLLHIGTILPITCVKDPGMIELWDDRSIQVEKNTGRRMDGKE